MRKSLGLLQLAAWGPDNRIDCEFCITQDKPVVCIRRFTRHKEKSVQDGQLRSLPTLSQLGT